jgi:hypothetical protein
MASLASVPAEILLLIFTYLECFADLTSVAGVCKGWRNAVHVRLRASQRKEPPYRQLPWLLQPSYDVPPSTITSFVSGTTGHRICLPEGVRRRDRYYCGSHEGGWVAVAADRRRPHYEFVNLINQASASIPLPNTLRSHPTRSEVVDEIRVVTLSDVPTAGSCIAAAHTVGGYPSIIFCRPHADGHWVPPLMDTEPLQDTLYHRGAVYQGFYAISNMDNLYVFLPREINNGETLVMRQVIISFSPALAMGRRVVASNITRYLVESRGKLLVVLRYSGMAMGTNDLRTLHFRVFEMELNELPNGGHSTAWVELDDLDGRIITVARGCSRAFEAAQYRGFQGGSIYFLDDAAVGTGPMYSIFSFADLGMYSMGETKIERPGLPTPALRDCLDGDGALLGRSAPRHPSQPQATEHELLRWLFAPRSNQAWDGRAEHLRMLAGCEPGSNCPYGPREIMVHTIRNGSHATELVTSKLKIVNETDPIASDEASSSTSAGGEQVVHETVASVWPLLCKPGNRRSIWFLPPSADEWLLPPPPADA